MSAQTEGGVHRKTKLRMANNSKGRAEMEGFKELGFELMYAGKDIQEGIELYESSHDLGSERWRAEHNIEAIRQKILAGMQPQDFPHARKVQPYLPRQQHGCCRHGLPVEYTFCGE